MKDLNENSVAMMVVNRICLMHDTAITALQDAISSASEAGRLLSEEKEKVPHGEFQEWVKENLTFSLRTAQKYMQLYENKEKLKMLAPASLSEAYKLIAVQKPEPEEVLPFSDEDEDVTITEAEYTVEPPAPEDPAFAYWPIVSTLVADMNHAYAKLTKMRNHTTPIALGNFIGNIKDMADRINTWNPEKLVECPQCYGEGQYADDKGVVQACGYCIKGMTGPSKSSKH